MTRGPNIEGPYCAMLVWITSQKVDTENYPYGGSEIQYRSLQFKLGSVRVVLTPGVSSSGYDTHSAVLLEVIRVMAPSTGVLCPMRHGRLFSNDL